MNRTAKDKATQFHFSSDDREADLAQMESFIKSLAGPEIRLAARLATESAMEEAWLRAQGVAVSRCGNEGLVSALNRLTGPPNFLLYRNGAGAREGRLAINRLERCILYWTRGTATLRLSTSHHEDLRRPLVEVKSFVEMLRSEPAVAEVVYSLQPDWDASLAELVTVARQNCP